MKEVIKQREEQTKHDKLGDKAKQVSNNPDRDLQIWRRRLDDIKAKTLQKKEFLNGIRDRY